MHTSGWPLGHVTLLHKEPDKLLGGATLLHSQHQQQQQQTVQKPTTITRIIQQGNSELWFTSTSERLSSIGISYFAIAPPVDEMCQIVTLRGSFTPSKLKAESIRSSRVNALPTVTGHFVCESCADVSVFSPETVVSQACVNSALQLIGALFAAQWS